MTEITGFSGGTPPNPEETWERNFAGGLVVYRKRAVADGHYFLYNCEWHRSAYSSGSTSWQTHHDLSRDEVEALPRFQDLLAGRI